MLKFLVFVLFIMGAAYPLPAQTVSKSAEIKLTPGPTITIDGKIEDAEWKGASSFPAKNGGTVFFGYDGNYLFVGVRGPAQGWSHLYVNEGEVGVLVYHASAALGMHRLPARQRREMAILEPIFMGTARPRYQP